MTQPITIPFKGDRDYAQIADIFMQMVEVTGAGAGRDLLFSVHAPLFTPFAVVAIVALGEAPPKDFAARLDYVTAQGQRCQAVVLAAPRDAPVPRRAFDEDALRDKIQLSGNQAICKAPVENDFAELITAMNKKLLQSLFPQENAKWWAVRLQLAAFETEGRNVTLTCKTTQPSRLYNSTISVDSTAVGEISFVSRPI